MSDLTKIRKILKRAGVVFEEPPTDGPPYILIEAKTGPNNLGYSGFHSEWWFNEEGALIKVGSWE